nr:kruppel-like factor 4 isoform Klf4-178 [Mus musculus]
MRRETLPL